MRYILDKNKKKYPCSLAVSVLSLSFPLFRELVKSLIDAGEKGISNTSIESKKNINTFIQKNFLNNNLIEKCHWDYSVDFDKSWTIEISINFILVVFPKKDSLCSNPDDTPDKLYFNITSFNKKNISFYNLTFIEKWD